MNKHKEFKHTIFEKYLYFRTKYYNITKLQFTCTRNSITVHKWIFDKYLGLLIFLTQLQWKGRSASRACTSASWVAHTERLLQALPWKVFQWRPSFSQLSLPCSYGQFFCSTNFLALGSTAFQSSECRRGQWLRWYGPCQYLPLPSSYFCQVWPLSSHLKEQLHRSS